jgi:hypothetical protein
MSILEMKKIDAMLRLFDGDVSLTELVHMDLPSQRALVQSRIDNLRESQEKLKKGIIDSFSISNRYGGALGSGPASLPAEEAPPKKPESRNLRATLYQDQH